MYKLITKIKNKPLSLILIILILIFLLIFMSINSIYKKDQPNRYINTCLSNQIRKQNNLNNFNINNNTTLLFTFCVYIGKYTKKILIRALKLQLKFLKKNVPNYFIICFTNFSINDNLSEYNLKFKDYYENNKLKLYNSNWFNLSFNKINLYKDLYDEYNKNFTWIDLDTLVITDISYINRLDNLFLEQGTNDQTMKPLFYNNNNIKIPANRYIQGDFWKINIDLYFQLKNTLKQILNQKLLLRYDLQDLFNYYIYIQNNGNINYLNINILGNNIFSNTVNGLSIWNNNKIQHPNTYGIDNLYLENNKIKTKLYPDKEIHILSFTFNTLNIFYPTKKFKDIFL